MVFRKGSFLHSVTLIASGTAMAQAISVLASPLLTRIYTPEEFGLFAVFTAFIASFAPAVTGSYELALVLPESEEMSFELYGVSIWFAIGTSALLLLFILLFRDLLLTVLNASELSLVLFCAPLFLFFTGLYNLAGYMANRQKQFNQIGWSKIVNVTSIVVLNLALGLLGFGLKGLLIAKLTGLIFGFVYLTYWQRSILKGVSLRWSKHKRLVATQYMKFPLLDASSGLLNGVTLSLPVYFLSSFYSDPILGCYSLMLRVIKRPFGFISNAVFQVYLRRVVEIVAREGDLVANLKKASFYLMLITLFPIFILTMWGPDLFAIIFGSEWRSAGEYARIMIVALSFRFVVSSLSASYVATNNPKYAFLRRIASFIMVSIALTISYFQGSIIMTMYMLSGSMIVEDIFGFFLIYRTSKKVGRQKKCLQ